MVPANFIPFFSVMAGVGATLFGLIFLVISIKPEVASAQDTTIMSQVQAASSYTALINPLVISLIALQPDATIGTITLVMSLVGLASIVGMSVNLLQDSGRWKTKLRRVFFIVSSLVLFGFELYYAIRLSLVPGDLFALYDLTTLFVIIYLYGIARAWDLVGARQFHIQDAFTPLLPKNKSDHISDKAPTESQ